MRQTSSGDGAFDTYGLTSLAVVVSGELRTVKIPHPANKEK